jgi:hypothetical protein
MVRMRTIGLILAILALGAGSAAAAVVYEAELTPELVQPSSGASAYGQATLIVNDAGTQLDLTLNFAGLDTPQTDAVLLRAAADDAGETLRTLPLGTMLAVSFDYEADLASALEDGELAIQIGSELWPGGAIRGNFVFVTVGVDVQTWSQIRTLFE